LAFIAKNDIDHCTIPDMPAKDAQPSSAEDCVHQGQDDEGGVSGMQFDNDFESFGASVDSDSESIFEERCPDVLKAWSFHHEESER
jgi:hypothetical protein